VEKVVNDNAVCLARFHLDSGSQRSYILKEIPKELNLPCLGEETLSHSLFGGGEMKEQEHKVYKVTLQSLDRKFNSLYLC
jgi:hypothetical protein